MNTHHTATDSTYRPTNLQRVQTILNLLYGAARDAGYFPPGHRPNVNPPGHVDHGAWGSVKQGAHTINLDPAPFYQLATDPRHLDPTEKAAATIGTTKAHAADTLARILLNHQAQALPVLIHELAHTQQTVNYTPPGQSLVQGVRYIPSAEGGATAFDRQASQQLAILAHLTKHIPRPNHPDMYSNPVYTYPNTYRHWANTTTQKAGLDYILHGQFNRPGQHQPHVAAGPMQHKPLP